MLRQTIECRNFQLDCVLSARVFWQVHNKKNRQREISQTVYKQTLRCKSLNSYNYFLCIGVYASIVWSKVGRTVQITNHTAQSECLPAHDIVYICKSNITIHTVRYQMRASSNVVIVCTCIWTVLQYKDASLSQGAKCNTIRATVVIHCRTPRPTLSC